MAGWKREELEKIVRDGKRFHGLKLHGALFGCCEDLKCNHKSGDGMNLERANFKGCALAWSNFRNCNLKFSIFEGANCTGANFDGANAHRANFKDATMCDAKFDVVDAFGVTITMDCKCFSHLRVNTGFYFGLLFYGFLMDPIPGPQFVPEEFKERFSVLLGPERFNVLKQLYATRQL